MISVVIPAFNEEKALPATLNSLLTQRGEYEVIIVDGGSTDRTRDVLQSFGFVDRASNSSRLLFRSHRPQAASRDTLLASRLLLAAPKGRASQMNAGAQQAQGEWLLFLHADTILPSGAVQRLNEMEADQAVQAGGFMHRFSGDDWRLRLISYLDNLRCFRSRVIYGDQAMFVRRRLFELLGGFPDRPILEDVIFCERLIKMTNPILLPDCVVTDSRKFVKMGVWRSLARVLAIILHVEYGVPTLSRTFFADVR